ncbi:unnamed protein product [Chrysoparadoxa australica]
MKERPWEPSQLTPEQDALLDLTMSRLDKIEGIKDLGESVGWRVDRNLALKYCVALHWKDGLEKSVADTIHEVLKWRKETGIYEMALRRDPGALGRWEKAAGLGVCFISGLDNNQRPILWASYNNMDSSKAKELTEWLLYCMELAYQTINSHPGSEQRLLIVVDCGSTLQIGANKQGKTTRRYGGVSALLKALQELAQVMNLYYSSSMGKLLLVDSGMVINNLYRGVSYFLDSATTEKMSFKSVAAAKAELLKLAPAESILSCFGGKNTYSFEAHSYLRCYSPITGVVGAEKFEWPAQMKEIVEEEELEVADVVAAPKKLGKGPSVRWTMDLGPMGGSVYHTCISELRMPPLSEMAASVAVRQHTKSLGFNSADLGKGMEDEEEEEGAGGAL